MSKLKVSGKGPNLKRNLNESRVEGKVAWVRLRPDVWCQVDADDLDRVLDYGRWWLMKRARDKTGYALSSGRKLSRTEWLPRTNMHRLVMRAEGKLQVDHINGDGLDNRKENLRFVNDAENQQNRPKANKNNIHSGVKNVYWHAPSGSWLVKIVQDGKQISFGYFKELDDAIERAKIAREEWQTHSPENRDIGTL